MIECARCGRDVMPWWKTVLHPGCLSLRQYWGPMALLSMRLEEYPDGS